MKVRIGLEDKNREGSIGILNRLLADEYVLYTKTRNYHWNVTGEDFREYHKFFEEQYEALDGIVDETAERARSLGGRAAGSMAEFLKLARLEEQPSERPDVKKMTANLLADHEALIIHLRQDLQAAADKYKDMGTSDFLTGLMEQHEKMAWMLRSSLE